MVGDMGHEEDYFRGNNFDGASGGHWRNPRIMAAGAGGDETPEDYNEDEEEEKVAN